MARGSRKVAKKVVERQSKRKAARKVVTSSVSKGKAHKILKKASKKTRVPSETKRKTVSTKRAKAKAQGNKKSDRASSSRPPKTGRPAANGSKLSAARKITVKRKAASLRANTSATQKNATKTLAAQKAAERVALEKQSRHYEKAVAYFNNRKFPRARLWFEKAADGPDPTIRHRAQVHVNICTKQVSSVKVKLRTADEYYDYGIKLINDRELEEAERCLRKALRMRANADYVYYATAVVKALIGDEDAALDNLRQAIELDPRNRLLARADADLLSLRDYPIWDELMSSDTTNQEDSEEATIS